MEEHDNLNVARFSRFVRTVGQQGFMGPQGEEVVEATSLAARLGAAIVDIEVRRVD